MTWLKRLLKKRKAKQFYIKCVKMLQLHEQAFSINGSLVDLQLMDYWRNKAEKAWEDYDRI